MIRAGLNPATEARRELSEDAFRWCAVLMAVMLIIGLIVERIV